MGSGIWSKNVYRGIEGKVTELLYTMIVVLIIRLHVSIRTGKTACLKTKLYCM